MVEKSKTPEGNTKKSTDKPTDKDEDPAVAKGADRRKILQEKHKELRK